MKALEKSRRQLLAHQRSPLCQRLVDLSKNEGLLEPYTYERERLQTNDYKGVEVRGSSTARTKATNCKWPWTWP